MSYKIRIPSTNSDKVGKGGAIEPGTPDYVITFPNESGEVATTSDIPQGGSSTIYHLVTAYTDDNNTTPQNITEWNLSTVANKTYKIKYFLRVNAVSSDPPNVSVPTPSDLYFYFDVSDYDNTPNFVAFDSAGYVFDSSAPGNNLLSESNGMFIFKISGDAISNNKYYNYLEVTFKSTENGILKPIIQNSNPGTFTNTLITNFSYMEVSLLE